MTSLASGCGDGGYPPAADDGTPGQSPIDAGAGTADGCGPSFGEAVAAHPGERVCQTTVYYLATGYCTFWQPCADLYR